MKNHMTLSLNLWSMHPQQLQTTVEQAIQSILDRHHHVLTHPPQWDLFYDHLHHLDLLERWWNALQLLQHVDPSEPRQYFLQQYQQSVHNLFSAIHDDDGWFQYVDALLKTLPPSLQRTTLEDYHADLIFERRLTASEKNKLDRIQTQKYQALGEFMERLDHAQSKNLYWPASHADTFVDDACAPFQTDDGLQIPQQADNLLDLLQTATDGPIRSELFNVYQTLGVQQQTPLYAKKWLQLCHKEAHLLHFNSPAHQFLYENAFKHPDALIAFLRQERHHHYRLARQEQQPLLAFMRDQGLANQPENMWFAMNQYSSYFYQHTEEELTPSFTFQNTLNAVHRWIEHTFNVRIVDHPYRTFWDSHVTCYQMFRHGDLIGEWVIDPFTRPHKYTDCSTSSWASYEKEGVYETIPSCLMSFNFEPEDQAFFWHQVQTVWHEYGHLLHHLLTQHPHPTMNGLRCPFDYIELPSMAMEKMPEFYPLFADLARQADGLPITAEHHNQWLHSHQDFEHHEWFHTLSLALYDVLLYTYNEDPQILWTQVWTELPPLYGEGIPYNYVIGQDTHIISDNYAGGTYSYYWGDYLIEQLSHVWGPVPLWLPRLLTDVLTQGRQDPHTYLAPMLDSIHQLIPSIDTSDDALALWLPGCPTAH